MPSDDEILAVVRERPDIDLLELARTLGCIRVEEHVTDECAAAFRSVLSRGVVQLGDRLGFVAPDPRPRDAAGEGS